MEDFLFQKLSKEDAFRSKEIFKALAVAAYGTHIPQLSPEGAATFIENIGKDEVWDRLLGNSHCFICTYQDNLVGMAFLTPSGNPWRFFEADWSYIRMVGVLPEFEGKGIARKIMGMCIDEARKLDEKIITLHTSEFMDAARHLYESIGFTILKEIEPQWGKRYWIYSLNVDQSITTS